MASHIYLPLLVLTLACWLPIDTYAHGYLAVPVSRNLYARQQGVFYDEMSGNGLGLGNNNGPGVCGDPFQGTNSNFVATPSPIQAIYTQGGIVQLDVVLTANHGGKFYFRLCPRSTNLDEACFGSNYLTRVDNGQRDTWLLTTQMTYTLSYQLPPTVSCDSGCVLQWKYFAMQNCIEPNCDRTYCGVYADGVNAVYGGRPPWCDATASTAEFFINCADIRITTGGTATPPPPAATSSPSPPPPQPPATPSPGPPPVIGNPPPSGVSSLLPSGPLNVAYYQTWSAAYASVGANMDLAKIPGYINVVIVSFVKPDCQYTKGSLTFPGTGLDFSSSGSVVKAAVAALKTATNGNTKVLLAVGGATYFNWDTMNVQCVKDLVDDLGFDGVDIDYEPSTSCTTTGGTISCSTDTQIVSVTAALRMQLPQGQYILSTATWHVGMYGEGAFVNSQPSGSAYKGVNLALAKSGAGQQLDLINIMTYDAGNIQSTGFNSSESYLAHRVYWRTQAIAIGVQVPPEAWGGNVITLPEVTQRASFARDNAGGAQYGIMLWSFHKTSGCPNSQQIAQTVCTAYNLGSCSTPLPITMAATCPSSSPPPPSTPPTSSPPPPATPPPPGGSCSMFAGPGGACGSGNGICCSSGQCCSQYGWCGLTDGHCLASNGCQSGYGTCTGVTTSNPPPPPATPSPSPTPSPKPPSPSPSPSPPPTPPTSGCSKYTTGPGGACGAAAGCCVNSQCCSKWGWCGTTDGHCQTSQGCQVLYGRCV